MVNIYYLLSIFLGSAGAWAVSRYAFKWGFVDSPDERSSHDRPTPKGGGIGILAAFVLASCILKIPTAFWAPAVFIALLSFSGDRFNLSPKLRLPLQLIAAFILLLPAYGVMPLTSDLWPLTSDLRSLTSDFWSLISGLRSLTSDFWSLTSDLRSLTSLLYLLFFVLFITATANWYNFMDGINGIAGITGIVGFSMLAAYNALPGGDSRFTTLSLCIAFSCLGFLPFNFPKARVFMGDVGSILLGFVFAAMVALLSTSFLEFVCLASLLFPFYADEWTTMAVRISDRENLLKPHRRHLYQLLANELGIAHWKVSAGYGILQVVVGACVLSAMPWGHPGVWTVLVIFFSMFVGINYIVRTRLVKNRESR